MTAWTEDELARIGTAEELEIASLRRDDRLGSPRTIWVVRDGDDLYVRSVNGPTAAWYRGTRERREGHIQAGGVDKDVTFVDAGHDLDDELDAAYRAKYGRYAASIVDAITSPQARTGDILGRRRMFVAGLALFTAASLAIGLAPSAAWLLAARAVQGVGAAILAPPRWPCSRRASRRGASAPVRSPTTGPSPGSGPASAWCSAVSSPAGSPGASGSSSTCRSGSP
jgi:hypothetical protein